MKQYLELIKHVRDHGVEKTDRTGTGTLSVFGYQMRFDLNQGFPAITTKKLHFKSIIHELLWFLQGATNISYLKDNGVSIWDEWADEEGNLGPVYGAQWRSWLTSDGQSIDQISQVIEQIKSNPDSRRLLVSAWNVGEISNMALAPCHAFFQFYVVDNKLSCQMYQRSADIFLGVPFNIASYTLLNMMVAQVTGLKLGEFILTIGDAHLYLNHLQQADQQLQREPYPLPKMKLNPKVKSIFDFRYEDFELIDYQSHPSCQGFLRKSDSMLLHPLIFLKSLFLTQVAVPVSDLYDTPGACFPTTYECLGKSVYFTLACFAVSSQGKGVVTGVHRDFHDRGFSKATLSQQFSQA